MLIIHNERIARLVSELAEREQRPVEQIIEAMADQYAAQVTLPVADPMKRLRARFYAKARTYWVAENNAERLALTDEVLDKAFVMFDSEGKPLLQQDIQSDEQLPALYRLADRVEFYSGDPTAARRGDFLAHSSGAL